MKFNLPKKFSIAKITILVIVILFSLFSLFSFSLKQTLSASTFKVAQPGINIKDSQAEFSFYLTNLTSKEVLPKGRVELKNQTGTSIFEKEINYKTPLSSGQTDKVSFYWEPNLKSLGRIQAVVVLKDNTNQQTQQEKFSFLVLPNILGGIAALSIVLIGSRGVLKITRLFIA
jgi:hypothetical protein